MEALVHTASPTLPYGSVTRWRRFGNDRLYVRSRYGADLGWWDLATDEGHPDHPQFADELEKVVRDWKEREDVPPRTVLREVPAIQSSPQSASETTGPRRAAGFAPAVRTEVAAPADLLANRAGEQLMRREAAEAAAGKQAGRRFVDPEPVESGWSVGAAGEHLVADELRKLAELDPRWGFINSIPVNAKGTDIDHLVIGPGGVFTINTKHHRDANIWVAGDMLMVNGGNTGYVRNARKDAARATARLYVATGMRITTWGMVVPVGAASVTIKESPADVVVVNRRRILSFFQSVPAVLDKSTVLRLFDAARDSRTWLEPDA